MKAATIVGVISEFVGQGHTTANLVINQHRVRGETPVPRTGKRRIRLPGLESYFKGRPRVVQWGAKIKDMRPKQAVHIVRTSATTHRSGTMAA